MRSAPALLCMSLQASPCSKQVLAERPMLACRRDSPVSACFTAPVVVTH
jgi:hypothetical protein